MRIGEFFAALGFQIEGADDLAKVQKSMDATAAAAGKISLGLDAITAGFLFMTNGAMRAGVELNKFLLTTGLSTDELQRWQHAAKVGNVSAEELASTVKSIQNISAQIALGQGNAGPWRFLGISPHDDPFAVLSKLQTELQSVDKTRVAMARNIMQQAGFGENIFQFLRNPTINVSALQDFYLMTQKNIEGTNALSQAWNNLRDRSEMAGHRFIAALSQDPLVQDLLGGLTRIVDKLTEFVDLLDSGSPAANTMREGIVLLAGAVGALALGFTALATAAKAAAFAAGALNIAAAPEIAIITALAGAVLLLTHGTEQLVSAYQSWKAGVGREGGTFAGFVAKSAWQDIVGNPAPAAGGTVIQQTNTVHVHDSGDPKATGHAVVSSFQKMIADATYSAPVPSR